MLQAVHLLLAFPLFVVVVAVDSRWLAHSLAEHYPALTVPRERVPRPLDGDEADQPTPSDYLEKIFQVPFWIEPLGEYGPGVPRARLAPGEPRHGRASDQPSDDVEPLAFSSDPMRWCGRCSAGRAVPDSDRRPSRHAGRLTFLDELAPLLGDTPRSIKRFVNVYQLLCALPVPPTCRCPCTRRRRVPPRATDGLPNLYVALHRVLERNDPQVRRSGAQSEAFVGLFPPLEIARYDEWAKEHGHLVGTGGELFAEPARRVRRFSFR